MNLGILLTPGDSLTQQTQCGQFERFLDYYLKAYAQAFGQIYIFSYGDWRAKINLPQNIILIPKPRLIPYQLYQFILPFLHRRIIKLIDVFRVFQVTGGIPAVLIKRLYQKPLVITYGYHYHLFAQVEKQPLKGWLINLLIKPILNSADKIIVTSKNNQAYLRRLGLKQKLTYIPNGVDPRQFKPAVKKQSPWLVLNIGRLTHQKNQALLLQAISLSGYKNKLRLVIIGSGSLKANLERQAENQRINLSVIDSVSHSKLIDWYQQAGIFILTSTIEGHPKVLLEALSCGCACLTTNFVGNLIKDQQSGLVAGNAAGLAKKLDQLLSRPQLRTHLGQAGRQLIINYFDIRRLIKKEIGLLKSCLN